MAGAQPIHVYLGDDEIGAAVTCWECPHCHARNPRRKPMTMHMGLVVNIPASCPVFKKEDERRRESLRKHSEEAQRRGYDDTWVWSPDKLEALRKEAADAAKTV